MSLQAATEGMEAEAEADDWDTLEQEHPEPSTQERSCQKMKSAWRRISKQVILTELQLVDVAGT